MTTAMLEAPDHELPTVCVACQSFDPCGCQKLGRRY